MKFKKVFYEAISEGDFDKATNIIEKYMKKYIPKVLKIPFKEEFKRGSDNYIGTKFVYKTGTKPSCYRLNWKKGDTNSASITDVSIWIGDEKEDEIGYKNPSYVVTIPENESLVTVLPSLVKAILNPRIGEFALNEDNSLNEDIDTDAKDDMLDFFKKKPKFKKSDIYQYRGKRKKKNVYKNFLTIMDDFPKLFKNTGSDSRPVWQVNIKGIQKIKPNEWEDICPMKVVAVRKSKKEQLQESNTVKSLKKIPFKNGLDFIRKFVPIIIKGKFNLMTILGRGGLGKCVSAHTRLSVNYTK